MFDEQMKMTESKVFLRPNDRAQKVEKVQCFDGSRVWEGTVLSVITDCTGLRLYKIKFDEAVDGTVMVAFCYLLLQQWN